jgi:hypothetical protein
MRYAIICEERGIFIGTSQGFAFFSKLDCFGAYKAYGFSSFEEAEKYADSVLSNDTNNFIFHFPAFETDEKYIPLVDFIKSGYEKYTGDMLLGMPCENELIH